MSDDSSDLRDPAAGDGPDETAPTPEIRFPDWLESRSAERSAARRPGDPGPAPEPAPAAESESAPAGTVPSADRAPMLPDWAYAADRAPAPPDSTAAEHRGPPRLPVSRRAPDPPAPAPHEAFESDRERSAEVEAWVARFRDPSGPPRIGSKVSETPPIPGNLEEAPVARPAAPPPPRAALRRPPASRRGSTRAASGSPLVTWIAAGLVVLAAGFVLSIATRNATRRRPVQRVANLTREPVAARPPAVEAPRPASPSSGVEAQRSELTPAGDKAAPVSPSSSITPRRQRHPASAASAAVMDADAGSGDVQPPAGPASAAAVDERRYGIEVATFMFEDRAREERDKLAAATDAGCSVAPAFEDGARVYRLLVGPLTGRARAESLGTDLFGRGLIHEARVVRWSGAANR
ncbi:MAG TPA: hypothetical protein VMS88_03410 [Terriglobales bacterium]|nr:hypothetical protein [Terriglobales bacterium]